MDQETIIQYIANTFEGVDVEVGKEGIAAGDTFFIYDPDRTFEGAQRMPFATIVTKDYGDYDNVSNLNRPGVYRLNIGVEKETYRSLFGPPPKPAEAGTGHDFAALDRVIPHPLYATQSWISVLNPSDETFETLRPWLAEAYDLAVGRIKRRRPRGES